MDTAVVGPQLWQGDRERLVNADCSRAAPWRLLEYMMAVQANSDRWQWWRFMVFIHANFLYKLAVLFVTKSVAYSRMFRRGPRCSRQTVTLLT